MWLEAIAALWLVLQAMAIVLLWQQGQRLKQSVDAKTSEAGGVPERLIIHALNKIEHRLALLEERGRRAEAHASPRPVETPVMPMAAPRSASLHASAAHYELAQQLAREGCELEELIARCGLSRNEAELVLRLYARRA